jgi:radical SAM protein with 4Fe4S-binding SPASM domain
MFISEDMKMYPCSFMVEAGHDGTPITEDNMQDFWQNADTLKHFRHQSTPSNCSSCDNAGLCLGGCPVFPEINLCPDRQDIGSG